jgi:tetratricopeptide (TPR) repeat protein
MPRYSALLLVCVTVFLGAARAEVRVWEGTLTLPTYSEGAPDPNPPFDLFETTRFNYPYTLRENLTNNRADHAWRAIYIENEYLKCSVLPDIGGHLYTCIDKLSGEPMFYANPSIKKAQIGYRGAWAAFGIEFNFPVSHNWVSMSPVDFAYGRKTDGSGSVTVGNIDRVYGMQWSVELVLRPGSTVLEERVRLTNRSDVRHRFYWWNNAGVQVWDDSQIEYPMRYTASHGFTEVQPWPVDAQGKDLSIIRNQTDGPVSLFVHGSREPFMGVWHPKTNTGVVHFANYAELPGKKIWSWGSDADGLDWRKALSDNGSAYVEVQGGLFRNQETYAFLEPRQSIHFSEYWMPVRELGGITRANLAGVLNLSRRGNNLVAAFNANEAIPQALIRVSDGNRAISEERVDLVPARTWKREVVMPDVEHKYTFELIDQAGTMLLHHTEREYDWTPRTDIKVGPQPTYSLPTPDKRTEDHWLEAGKDEELNGKTLAALGTYEEGLRKFPDSFELHKAAGRDAACLLRYDDAVRHLTPIEKRDVTDPEVAYYLAIAYDGLGQESQARTAYENAYRLPRFRAPAALRLGELEARQGRLKEAESYLEEGLRAAPDDIRAAEELAAMRNALGEQDSARRLAQEWLRLYPLSYFLREELRNPNLQHLGADAYRVLNIAGQYMRLGLYKSAIRVLARQYPASSPDQSEPGAVLPQNHVLVAYFRAYCKEKLGDAAAQEYGAASRLSTQYVFPNSAAALEVLTSAIRANASDGTAHYLLGTFLFSRGLSDAALREWEAAAKLAPATPVLDADMGRALLRVKRNPEAAAGAFEHGMTVDGQNAELYGGLDQALSLLQKPASVRVQALERYPDLARMPAALIYELGLNRAEAEDFTGAVDLFRDRFFPREEGGTNVRQVWIEVRLLEAISFGRRGNCATAVSEIENLGREVPGFVFTHDGLAPMIDSARAQYLAGGVLSRCGQPDRARVHFERAAQQTGAGQIFWAFAANKKLQQANVAEWRQELETALKHVKTNNDTGSRSSWSMYNEGLLESALEMNSDADAAFEEALLLPDSAMAHHLTRVARGKTLSLDAQ